MAPSNWEAVGGGGADLNLILAETYSLLLRDSNDTK